MSSKNTIIEELAHAVDAFLRLRTDGANVPASAPEITELIKAVDRYWKECSLFQERRKQ